MTHLILNHYNVFYKLKGEIELAIQNYDTAMKLDPSFAYAYNNRGIIYYEREDYDLAIIDYTKAIELRPDLVHPYNNRNRTETGPCPSL